MEPLPFLGELETAVLESAWTQQTTDARTVHATIGTARGITLSTIQSTLERLHRKKLLHRTRVGHAFIYTPVLTREEYRARAVAGLAGALKGAEGAGVLAAFVDLAAEADRKNLDRLAALVDAARARKGRS